MTFESFSRSLDEIDNKEMNGGLEILRLLQRM